MVGASVAYHLAERGAGEVIILERESQQGMGSTGAATGGIRAQFETDINIQMSLYSVDFFKSIGFDCGYEPRGYLFFATTVEQFAYLTANVAKQKSLGVEGVEVLDCSDIRKLVPGMNCDDIVGGSFGANDGFINPIAVMDGFTRGALSGGAQIRLNVRVSGIECSGDKVKGLRTDDGVVECDKVVICTGAWARDLAATAGVDLPVEPMRRQIVWARAARPLPEMLPMVIDLGTGFHFRPAKGSRDEVLFAYPDPDEVRSFERTLVPKFVAKICATAASRAPFLGEAEVMLEKCRVGLYENTPDHHAILGGCDIDGLYFANGFSGHGVMHSPATGRALAEIMLDGGAKFLDVSCLSIDRFKTGKLLHETAFI